MSGSRTGVERVVSGGQTGVDRSALDAAMTLGIPVGGWIPRGRRAEDGTVPERYTGLIESDSDAYAQRTELNVRDSDATLVLVSGPLAGGTALTVELARSLDRPVLVLDLADGRCAAAAAAIRAWLARTRPRTLNVAGPRESEAPGLGLLVGAVLRAALAEDSTGSGEG